MKAFIQKRPVFIFCALTLALVLILALLVQPALADAPSVTSMYISEATTTFPMPEFLPAERTFYGLLTVTIQVDNPYEIVWSSEDTVIGPFYAKGYTTETAILDQTTTLYAHSHAGSFFHRNPAYETFTKQVAGEPVISFADGRVNISGAADENETIYYTTNGSVPTTSSQKYTAPFVARGTVQAVIFGKTCEEDTGAYGNVASFDVPAVPYFVPDALTLENAVLGSAYSQQIPCMGEKPMEFSLTMLSLAPASSRLSPAVTPLSVTPMATVSGLPEGLSLSPTGLLSGTPTRVGTYTFTVWAKNALGVSSADFTLTVLPAQDSSTGGLRWYTPSADAPMLGGSDTDASRQDVPQGDANPNTGVR